MLSLAVEVEGSGTDDAASFVASVVASVFFFVTGFAFVFDFRDGRRACLPFLLCTDDVNV